MRQHLFIPKRSEHWEILTIVTYSCLNEQKRRRILLFNLCVPNSLFVVIGLFRWIPFAMLSARQEDTVTGLQQVRCIVRRASV